MHRLAVVVDAIFLSLSQSRSEDLAGRANVSDSRYLDLTRDYTRHSRIKDLNPVTCIKRVRVIGISRNHFRKY
jgi:hypothetical protein